MAQAKHLVVDRSLHARSQGFTRSERVATRAWTSAGHSRIRQLDPFAATSHRTLPGLVRRPAIRLAGFVAPDRIPLFDDHRPTELAPSLRRFLDDGPPPVLFTPGTANQAAARFFKAGVDAAGASGVGRYS